MCDPISIGLTLAGTAMQSYGQSQVASAQKRDIRAAGESYEAERGRQRGFEDTNAKTVADTLATYSRPNMDSLYAGATAKRQADYVSPLQAKNFNYQGPADFDPNSAVTSRNAVTGDQRKAYSIDQALSKAKLDAYGDANQTAGFHAADNAGQVGMTNRISSGSRQAEGVRQGALQSRLQADQHQGDTIGGIGDLFTMAGMLGAGGGLKGIGDSLFGAKLPVMGPGLPAGTPATYGRSVFGMQF